MRAQTMALVDAARALGVVVDALDLSVDGASRLRRVLTERWDALYAVAGARLLDGGGLEEARRVIDLLDLAPSPLVLRVADAPYMSRYFDVLERLHHRAFVSGRDLHLADFMEGARWRPRGMDHCPGRIDTSTVASAPPIRSGARDLPYLVVANVEPVGVSEKFARDLVPEHFDLFISLSEALGANTSRPAWRVAQSAFSADGGNLVPWRGRGRVVLQAAMRRADARLREAIIERLLPRPGLMIIGANAARRARARTRAARVMESATPGQVGALMSRSRVVVSMPPRMLVGAISERVYNAMAAGAVVAEIDTIAMKADFEAGRHFAPYLCPSLEGLEETIETAIARPDDLQPMATAGRERAISRFAPMANVRRLLSPVFDPGAPCRA